MRRDLLEREEMGAEELRNTLIDNNTKNLLVEITISEESIDFTSSIQSAKEHAELELYSIEETMNSIQEIKPTCDNLDYALAASSGAICGVMDIFLVGKPGESPLGEITDKWFSDRTMDFARICGWSGKEENSLSSAIRFLEKKFKISKIGDK